MNDTPEQTEQRVAPEPMQRKMACPNPSCRHGWVETDGRLGRRFRCWVCLGGGDRG